MLPSPVAEMGCLILCSLPMSPPPARCRTSTALPLVFPQPSAGFINAVHPSTLLGLSLNSRRNRRPFPDVRRNSNAEGQDHSSEDEDSTVAAKKSEEILEMERKVGNEHLGLQSTETALDDNDEENVVTAVSETEDDLALLTEILQSQASTILPVNDLIDGDSNGLSVDANNQGLIETQEEVLPEDQDPLPLAGSNAMNIVFVAAECAPWSKTGGLGDVVGELPKALARRGHRVMVVAPRYGKYVEAQEVGTLRRYKADGQDFEVTYHHAYIDCVDFVFIDAPVFWHIEHDIYSGSRREILKRMIVLCKAAVEVPWHVPCGGVCYGEGNLVFVANDWHTALLPVYLKEYHRNRGSMKYARSVLVIHNISYQGRGPLDDYPCMDLPDHCIDLFDLYDPVGGQHLNILAAGLKCADRVVTVSRGYAWELRTPEGGWGLHELINEIGWKFDGILNGINPQMWNPKFDAFLTSDGYTNYDTETLQTGKAQCKAALQRELDLEVRHGTPIVAFIGRLDGQKGVELIADAMHWFAGQDLQLVMLGTGRADLEDKLRKFERENKDRVRGWVGFSVKLAHRITAGADVLLMPSRFEPCGLNQLYAMMYGTVPVVHAVGGLRDTVQQYDPVKETGVGWTFDRAESHKMIEALAHCLKTYRHHRESWERLQTRGMAMDSSWDKAAEDYERVLVTAKYQW